MTVTYGFYDSFAGDRKYNARQMSQLFKGIITDGVFSTVGGGLLVTVNSGMVLNVASGRCWFNNTWTDNDATITVTVLASEAVLNRIDSVVVEVNSDNAVRANSIKVIKGTPATTPVAPTLSHTATLNQYSLADIYVGAGVTSINAGNITNKIGSVSTPFASGAVPSFDFGPVLTGWQATFSTWFNNLVDQLSGSQVTNLQNQIDVLTAEISKVDNYKITPSVSGNNLTLSIKTLAGTDPSAGNPVRFKIGDTVYSLTAATSFTKNAGTNWMNLGSSELAGQLAQVFVYAIGETGASAGLKFGYSRLPYATIMADFVNSTTSEKYIAGNWTNFNALDNVTVIGRFNVQLSAAASYNWSISSPFVINRPIYETDWLSWSPTVSGITLGSAYKDSAYRIINKILHNNFTLILSGSTVSTPVFVTLPFTPISAGMMECRLIDTGSASYWGSADLAGGTKYVRVTNASGAYLSASIEVSASVPHVWANTDIISWRSWDHLA